jgi:flagellar motor switch protein FliN
MNEEISNEVQMDIPEEELSDVPIQGDTLRIEDIRKVKLPVTAGLGVCPLRVREVLELKEGSVLHLDKLAGEMSDILVGDVHLARGEVVVLGDVLHVRIAEIIGMLEREQEQQEQLERQGHG